MTFSEGERCYFYSYETICFRNRPVMTIPQPRSEESDEAKMNFSRLVVECDRVNEFGVYDENE
jgi:hypothetical protein